MGRLLFAALLALSGHALAEDPHWLYTPPRAVMSVNVPEELESLGVPLRIEAIKSEAPITELTDYYYKAFIKAGLWVPPLDRQFMIEGGISLTALDPDQKVSYTVIFQPNRDDSVTLIVGVADLFRQKDPQQAKTDVPLLPGARGVVVSRSESGETISYRVKATEEQVRAYYRQALGQLGFEPGDGEWFSGPAGQEVQVRALEHQDGAGAVDVSIVRRRPARAPASTEED